MPMTPLSLYSSTNKILCEYLNTFIISKDIYKELYRDILSLIFYFKIPIIGLKWNDNYRPDDRNNSIRYSHKDKSGKKAKEQEIIEEEKNPKLVEINRILKNIIAILYDLLPAFSVNKKK